MANNTESRGILQNGDVIKVQAEREIYTKYNNLTSK